MMPPSRIGKSGSGFSLVELLVVLAITSILMALIFGPLVQTFNLTRDAQAESEAQAFARQIIERISNEVANATYVRDNSIFDAQIAIVLPQSYFRDGGLSDLQRQILLPYAKLDFFPPSKGDPGNPEYNPYIGKIDPTIIGKAPVGNINLPLARGVSMVRYFVGLWDPFKPYGNKYEERLVAATAGDNLFVLYRAEVIPILPNGEVNTDFFEVGPDGGPLLDDPLFFTVLQNDPQEKLRRVQNWLEVAEVVTPEQRSDMLRVLRDRKSGDPVWDQDGRPQAMSLVTFEPTKIDDEPAAAYSTTVLGEEAPERTPTGFQTQYGGWTDGYSMKVWRASPVAGNDFYYTRDEYLGGRWRKTLWHRYPSGNGTADERVFDITAYLQGLQSGSPRLDWAIESGIQSEPLAFVVDPVSGDVTTSLPREHYDGQNGMQWFTGNALTYIQDPNPNPTTINGRLNYQYLQHPVWGRRIERFLWLKEDPGSPLTLWPSASITPGSDVVYGPDQRPGPHYGRRVRYRRVPSLDEEPGPNEYRINYYDLDYNPQQLTQLGFDVNDPDVQAFILPRFEDGYIKFYSDPNYPMPTGTVVVQFRFQLNRSGDVFTVDYASKELLTISFGVKRYEGSTGTPHLTSLTNRVHVRNFLR